MIILVYCGHCGRLTELILFVKLEGYLINATHTGVCNVQCSGQRGVEGCSALLVLSSTSVGKLGASLMFPCSWLNF